MNEMFNPRRKKDESRKALTGKDLLSENLPGTDTFDDGLENGKLLRPGSTSTGSGGAYMEHKGPNDMVHRAGSKDEAHGELDPEVTITDDLEELDVAKETKGDAADEWLRKNDPRYHA